MYNFAILISGLSIVLSIFLLVVTFGVTRRRKFKILTYITAVFVIILISNVLYALQTFSIIPTTGYEVTFLLSVELATLLLFYVGISRGLK